MVPVANHNADYLIDKYINYSFSIYQMLPEIKHFVPGATSSPCLGKQTVLTNGVTRALCDSCSNAISLV